MGRLAQLVERCIHIANVAGSNPSSATSEKSRVSNLVRALNMRKLKIKPILQEERSVECGIVVLAMLHSYYKTGKSIADLRKEIKTYRIGTYAPQLGQQLINSGFDVEIVTRNPLLVEKSDEKLSQQKLLLKFEEKLKKFRSKDNKSLGLNYFVSFMKSGGKLRVKIPDFDDIKSEIDEGRPVIAFLTNAALYQKNIAEILRKDFSYTFHAVLITGVSGDRVFLNDPYWGEEGGEKKYSSNELFYAMHSSILGDVDNGSLIKVRTI